MNNKKVEIDTPISFTESSRNKNIIYTVLLLLTAVVRIFYLFSSDNAFNGDSISRLYFCYIWYHSPSIMVGCDWLPLHFYMLGIPMAILKETIWTPRIVTLIIGVLSMYPLLRLSRKIFGEGVAIGTCLIFALLPAHILLSVVTLSEVPFIFFLLWAIYYTFDFLDTHSVRDLILMIVFLSMANFIRFEGWLFTFLILLVLFQSRVSFKTITYFVAGVSPLIIYILIATWYISPNHDPFWGLNESDRFVRESLIGVNPWVNAQDIPDAFLPLWLLFVPAGILYSIRKIAARRYLFLFSVPLIYALYKIFTLSLTGQYRYFMTTCVLSLPFFVKGLYEIVSLVFRKYEKTKVLVAGVLCISLCLTRYDRVLLKPIEEGGYGRFLPGFISSAVWAKENIKESRLIVDDDFFSTYSWMVYADKIARNNLTDEKSYCVELHPDLWKDSTAMSSAFYNYIKQNKVTYIVLFKNGNLAARLQFHDRIESINDIRLEKVYEFNDYRIYKIY